MLKVQLPSFKELFSANLIWLVVAIALSMFQSIVNFYLTLYLYEEENRNLLPFAAGLATAPGIYFSFLSGKLIDKYGIRKVVLIMLSIYLLALALITSQVGYGSLSVTYIMSFIALQSLASGAIMISVSTIIPKLYEKSRLRAVYAAYSFIYGSALTFAPVVAGVAYGLINLLSILLSLAATSVLLSIILFLNSQSEMRTQRKAEGLNSSGYLAEMVKRGLHRYSIFYSLINIINGLTVILLPAYLLGLFDGNHKAYSLIATFIALSTLFGSIFSAIELPFKAFTIIAVSTIAGAFFGRILFSFSDSITILCLLLVARGFFTQIGNMANQMEWVEKTNVHNRAGLFGLRRIFGQGGYPIVSLIFGAGIVVTDANLDMYFIRTLLLTGGVLEVILALIFVLVITKFEFSSSSLDSRNI